LGNYVSKILSICNIGAEMLSVERNSQSPNLSDLRFSLDPGPEKKRFPGVEEGDRMIVRASGKKKQ